MREILFKAKRTDNGEWMEGYYCKRKTGHYIDICFVEEYKDCIIKEFSDGGISWCDIAPETVCQYTGLIDRNGRKIFEGDIVNCGGKLVVTWKENLASFCLSKKGWMYQHFFGEAVNAVDVEVIGNIFDNPELVKEDGSSNRRE